MKNTLKNAVAITVLCTLIGTAGFIMNKSEKANAKAIEPTDIVDLSEVTSYTVTESGLKLNFMDGNIYSLDAPEKKEKYYVYPICNVIETYNTETETILVCIMPNGELHAYKIEDAPEGKIELVCFRTYNQDDYTTYEVVGVR